MKLGLGAVQFGLTYGISNQHGQTTQEEVRRILELAHAQGIQVIDTAPLYGGSEEAIGTSWPKRHDFRVVTKSPKFQGVSAPADASELLEKTFETSLARLKLSGVYGYLFHDAQDLLGPLGPMMVRDAERLKERGLIQRLGVSVYSEEQIFRIVERYRVFDLIQLPLNVFDQRLLQSGCLDSLKSRGYEIHVRSVFLQGLLLMEPSGLPSYFNSVRDHLDCYRREVSDRGWTPVQAALGYVLSLPQVDQVICGVNTSNQLRELCESAFDNPVLSGAGDLDFFTKYGLDDPKILNPSQWVLK